MRYYFDKKAKNANITLPPKKPYFFLNSRISVEVSTIFNIFSKKSVEFSTFSKKLTHNSYFLCYTYIRKFIKYLF